MMAAAGMISDMTRRSGPIPGVPQRGNTATFDPNAGVSYRTTLTFAPTQAGPLRDAARSGGVTIGKLLVHLVELMEVDKESGSPTWAAGTSLQMRRAESIALFASQPGRRFRVTVEFPPKTGGKLVAAAQAAGLTVAEVVRVEAARLLQQLADHDHTAAQAPLPVQLQLRLPVAA